MENVGFFLPYFSVSWRMSDFFPYFPVSWKMSDFFPYFPVSSICQYFQPDDDVMSVMFVEMFLSAEQIAFKRIWFHVKVMDFNNSYRVAKLYFFKKNAFSIQYHSFQNYIAKLFCYVCLNCRGRNTQKQHA